MTGAYKYIHSFGVGVRGRMAARNLPYIERGKNSQREQRMQSCDGQHGSCQGEDMGELMCMVRMWERLSCGHANNGQRPASCPRKCGPSKMSGSAVTQGCCHRKQRQPGTACDPNASSNQCSSKIWCGGSNWRPPMWENSCVRRGKAFRAEEEKQAGDAPGLELRT